MEPVAAITCKEVGGGHIRLGGSRSKVAGRLEG